MNVAGIRVADGELQPEQIDESMLSSTMESGAKGLPPPDLVIRTSGKNAPSTVTRGCFVVAE